LDAQGKTDPEKLKTREQALKIALDLARRQWAVADFELQVKRAEAEILPQKEPKTAVVPLLGKPYYVTHPEGQVTRPGTAEDVRLEEMILLLHYLTEAGGSPVAGKMITYQQIPDGRLYYPNFLGRTIGILKAVFKDDVDALYKAALDVGGRPAEGGDLAATIQALPRVEYTLVLWRGDHEFSPEITIIFDESVTEYLPAEDITVLAGMMCMSIVKSARK